MKHLIFFILLLTLFACASNPVASQQKNEQLKTTLNTIDPIACAQDAKPAMMIVEGTNDNPEQFQKYTEALIAAKLYPQLQGYYAAVGDPADVFEGQWPEKKFAVIARFPCLARAQQFWKSDIYENIKPLREGAGEVRVVVFEELSVPSYIGWQE